MKRSSGSSIIAGGPGVFGHWRNNYKTQKAWRQRIERSVRYRYQRRYFRAGWYRRWLLEDAIRRDVRRIEKSIIKKIVNRNPWIFDPYILRLG
jgi:hypothetical protein